MYNRPYPRGLGSSPLVAEVAIVLCGTAVSPRDRANPGATIVASEGRSSNAFKW